MVGRTSEHEHGCKPIEEYARLEELCGKVMEGALMRGYSLENPV